MVRLPEGDGNHALVTIIENVGLFPRYAPTNYPSRWLDTGTVELYYEDRLVLPSKLPPVDGGAQQFRELNEATTAILATAKKSGRRVNLGYLDKHIQVVISEAEGNVMFAAIMKRLEVLETKIAKMEKALSPK